MLTRASTFPAQDETGTANIIAAHAAAMSMILFIRSCPLPVVLPANGLLLLWSSSRRLIPVSRCEIADMRIENLNECALQLRMPAL
jgi:hypothetical protein